MKRIAMLLSVVALMAVMMAMSVSPAFAAWNETVVSGVYCRMGAGGDGGYGITTVGSYPPFVKLDRNGDGWVCYEYSVERGYHFYEDRLL